jgi:hypothetical protein
MRFSYQDVRFKLFMGREKFIDCSKHRYLSVRVSNPSKTRVKISLALCTGPQFEYHESPIDDFDLRPGKRETFRYRLTQRYFKCAASGWRWTSKVADLDDVRRMVFVVHPASQVGEVIFEQIELVK